MMKKILLGTVLAVLASSCVAVVPQFVVKGNGKVATTTFDVSLDYSAVSVSQGITVVLEPSSEGTTLVGKGTISADEEIMEYVSVVQENGHVKVSYKPRVQVRNMSIETVVKLPVSRYISRLHASSAGRITSEATLTSDDLSVDGSSAARISLPIEARELSVELSSAAGFDGHIVADDFEVDLSSAASCEVEGSAHNSDLEASSASHFRGFGFESTSVDAHASSGASIEITAMERIDGEASSGAVVRYKGSPVSVNSKTSSGGSVRSIQ